MWSPTIFKQETSNLLLPHSNLTKIPIIWQLSNPNKPTCLNLLQLRFISLVEKPWEIYGHLCYYLTKAPTNTTGSNPVKTMWNACENHVKFLGMWNTLWNTMWYY